MEDFEKSKIDVIIPTYRPDNKLEESLNMLNIQTILPSRILIINTLFETNDDTKFEKYIKYGNIEIKHISPKEFNHGRTRNLGASLSNADYLLFLTQDAVPCNNQLIENLLNNFSDPQTALVYARQTTEEYVDCIEKLTRKFNYPKHSLTKKAADKKELGIKIYFNSNVCAMYKKEFFDKLGGFPDDVIFNEDMLFASKAINAGYNITYSSIATVFHSHQYNTKQLFRRYFDLAVSQKQNEQLFKELSSNSEGIKFIRYILSNLSKEKKWIKIPFFLYHSIIKYTGFLIGYQYKILPNFLRKRWSMNPNYWEQHYN